MFYFSVATTLWICIWGRNPTGSCNQW